MYLSKIELQGFKSFADRTVLQFDPGITAIVGPNGCGKSNIVDAVRWVIGEQRARILRSEKMENVIFNGTTKRRPLGMSEVLLTVENNRGVLPIEYSDVELGRRLYRSGDSEYLMNGVQCRLKDITDLFMDTGMGAGAYSVIELKMVDEILSDNADDRRRLFEEAAGITKYKLRRRQTLNKLDNTQTDLTRIRDLTEEIGKQVRSLQRQAKKAERYREASEQLHELELALAHVEYTRLAARKRTLDEEIGALQTETVRTSDEEAQQEEVLKGRRAELARCEERLDARRAELNVHLEKVRELETERRLGEDRLDSARSELQHTHREQETADARRADLVHEVAELEASLADAEPELQRARDRLETVRRHRDAHRAAAQEKRQTLQELRQKERVLENDRSEQRRRLDRLLNRRELIGEDIERTEMQIRGLDASLDQLRTRVTDADEARALAEGAVDEAQSALEEAAREQALRRRQLDESLERLRMLERKRDAVAAEVQLLESMLTSFEDFSGAVRYLADSDWFAGNLTTVADLLACDADDRAALDAALGSFAGCIVVHTVDEARGAVCCLREHEQGRATFIVLERLEDAPAPGTPSIEATPMRRLVRTAASRYDKLADVLLRSAYVVDTLDQAEALAREAADRTAFFARTGEWVDAQGIIHGGSHQEGTAAAGRLGRREQLEKTRKELEAVDRELATVGDEVAARRRALKAAPYDVRREQLGAAERGLHEAEKLAARERFELRSSERRHEELLEQIDRARSSLRATSGEAESLESVVTEAAAALGSLQSRLADAEAAFESAEAESRKAGGAFNDANIAAIEARNRRDNHQRDLERARGRIRDLQERADARGQRIRELEHTIHQTNERLEEVASAWERIEGRQGDLEDAVSVAESAVRTVREAISGVEAELRGLRRQREQLMREEHQRAVSLAEVKTRAADLVDHVMDEFNISLPEAVANGSITVPADFDEKEARSRVGELRRSIRSLGGVNELALETYEEEKERLDFLTKQQEDLERAEEKLLETIDEINTTASKRFMETYEAIRINFARIFNDLFGMDAAADLELEEPDDPLETAIEIMARPRGKRPSTISQLSGGEKTLTAIALLFGIYLVKPSPFCILDEVDAPLDDANVERFMRLIRQFSENTQFILVTHNKLTMEGADRLYGITMQEQGVSRLVGVKFDEAVRMSERPAPREAA